MYGETSGIMHYADDQGSIDVMLICQGHLLQIFEGSLDHPAFDAVIPAIEQTLRAQGSMSLMTDMGNLKAYTSSFRKRWTNWILKNAAALPRFYGLTSSHLVLMGVRVVALATGKEVIMDSSREEFEKRVRRLNPLAFAKLRASRAARKEELL
ncbi:MAG TPA: hypothetical protein VJN18_23675 [Polyangiaceae bacterium]|nr:hypothetical protein [Polyangiaceae bacterium]